MSWLENTGCPTTYSSNSCLPTSNPISPTPNRSKQLKLEERSFGDLRWVWHKRLQQQVDSLLSLLDKCQVSSVIYIRLQPTAIKRSNGLEGFSVKNLRVALKEVIEEVFSNRQEKILLPSYQNRCGGIEEIKMDWSQMVDLFWGNIMKRALKKLRQHFGEDGIYGRISIQLQPSWLDSIKQTMGQFIENKLQNDQIIPIKINQTQKKCLKKNQMKEQEVKSLKNDGSEIERMRQSLEASIRLLKKKDLENGAQKKVIIKLDKQLQQNKRWEQVAKQLGEIIQSQQAKIYQQQQEIAILRKQLEHKNESAMIEQRYNKIEEMIKQIIILIEESKDQVKNGEAKPYYINPHYQKHLIDQKLIEEVIEFQSELMNKRAENKQLTDAILGVLGVFHKSLTDLQATKFTFRNAVDSLAAVFKGLRCFEGVQWQERFSLSEYGQSTESEYEGSEMKKSKVSMVLSDSSSREDTWNEEQSPSRLSSE